jgi:serine protease Do
LKGKITVLKELSMGKGILGAILLLLSGCFLLLITGAEPCNAGMYKYKDENGVWHFSDAPVALPEESETMEGMVERSTQLMDLRGKLTAALTPRNDIETAVTATVAIESSIGFGSGFFISETGHILTNKHVLQFTDDQEKQVTGVFEGAETKLRDIEEKLQREAEQLKNTKRDLEERKTLIESQPNSTGKEINRNRYLSDMQATLVWEENYIKRKKEVEQRKKELWEKKTNYKRDASVAALSQSFTIYLADNTKLNAYLVKRSDTQDLALLKIDGYTTPFLKPVQFDILAKGDPVYAIGNPVKLKNSVASGTFSGFEGDFAKTDAQIYPGNSGGPLITKDGKVIGVNTFKEITHKFEGLGFAITMERALAEFAAFLP